MQTQITATSKGFVAQVSWSDGTKINSRPFSDELDAKFWLLQQVEAQHGHIYRDKPVQRIMATLAAVAILLPLALPSVAQYTPPNTGGPTTSTATGTR